MRATDRDDFGARDFPEVYHRKGLAVVDAFNLKLGNN
jgi:hypothetical protein